MKIRSSIVLFVLLISYFVTAAQPYYFKHYLVENGLSNNSVRCSYQDKDGFMWFVTINGLNLFDGYGFKIFRNDPQNSSSTGSNFVISLYGDNNNTLWIGTNKGVYKYSERGENSS